MAGTGVGKFSSTAGSNTANMTVNFAENMAPSNVNNAARELMGHMRDMYEQLGDGYFEFGDGDGVYTIARVDADTLTVATAADLSAIYFAGRKIRVTDGGANVVEGTITSTSHGSSLQTVNLTGISLASGTPTKVEIGIDTAAFGGRIILDDNGNTFIEAPTDDTIDIHIAGAKDFVFTANTFTAESGSTIAAQALTATTVTASGIVKTDDTTNATSTTDGSLQTDGGLSVVLDAVIGDDLFMKSDAAIIHFGANSDVTMTHVADAGLTITSAGNLHTLQLQSNDADENEGPVLMMFRNSGSPVDDDILGKIKFAGLDGAGNVTNYGRIETLIMEEANGSEDATMEFRIMKGGSERNVLELDRSEVIINEDGQDIDFRVESSGNTHAFFIEGSSGAVGIGESSNSPLGNLHIKASDSGAGSVNSARGQFVIEGSGNAGMTILTGTSSVGGVGFGDSGGNLQGLMQYNHATDNFEFNTSSSVNPLILNDTGQLSTNGEVAPDTNLGGITLNQGANDGNIITLKSSDIAHGITNDAETDTYATIGKAQGATGGLQIKVMAEALASERLVINTNGGGDLDDTKSASGAGAIHIGVNNRNGDGTNVTNVNTDANLLVIRNFTTTQFIFDAEGTFHSNVGTATYDEYDDAQLVRAMDLSTSTKGLIASKFDDFVKYNHEDLAAARIVGREEDGTPNSMVNWTAMSQLHNGAIWQQYEKTERLANAVYELAKAAVGEEKANEILEQNKIKLLN